MRQQSQTATVSACIRRERAATPPGQPVPCVRCRSDWVIAASSRSVAITQCSAQSRIRSRIHRLQAISEFDRTRKSRYVAAHPGSIDDGITGKLLDGKTADQSE